MEQQNSQPSNSSFVEQTAPTLTNIHFRPPQVFPYQQQWPSSQIPTPSTQVRFSHINYSQPPESYSGSFTHLLQEGTPDIASQTNYGILPTSPPSSQPSKARKKRAQKEKSVPYAPNNRKWSVEEDEALAKAWVSISDDSIIGDEQANQTLWDRIFCAFGGHMKGASKDRNSNSLACRWNSMQRECSKFEGYYERCCRQKRSGTNLRDDIQMARDIFSSEEGVAFKWDKAWDVLKDEPKWNAKMLQESKKKRSPVQLNDDDADKKKKLNDDDPNETPLNEEETIPRPIGRKRAKERRNNDVGGEGRTDVIEYLSKIQTTMEAQSLIAQDLAKSELELVAVKKQAYEAKKQAMDDKRKKDIFVEEERVKKEILIEEERVMMFDWSQLPVELQVIWKDRQSIIREKWVIEGRLTRTD